MRFFNTAGPIVAGKHYCIPPLQRLELDNILSMVEQWKYFVLHAPRQTGKTSSLLALRDELNGSGRYHCVYVNVEIGQSAREDVTAAMQAILGQLARSAIVTLDDRFPDDLWQDVLERSGGHGALQDLLSRWAEAAAKPLVLMLDEIDALVGDTLLSVLRQLRAGYPDRPRRFPQSVILCGVRDVRDYRIHSGNDKAVVAGGSAFNVKAESLRLGDFSPSETRALLALHTEATGQVWEAAALDAVWDLTRGQPWLVNALAYEVCFRDKAGRERSRALTADAVKAAREQLIARRETHLDQLTDKLQEERVRRVVEPLLSGLPGAEALRADDLQYVRDLGLVSVTNPVTIANPIYREVIPRDLTYTTQATITHEPAWYIDGGQLQTGKLLAAFQTFFREHSEHWVERFQYKEAGPQLLLQAFLQRIVNSGGRIEREYGLGRMRTDLLLLWPLPDSGRLAPKAVVECKLVYGSVERTIEQGLEQTCAYLERCEAAEGHLVIFDRDAAKSWEDKVFRRERSIGDTPISIWGM